ncbi:hypothetical protein HRR90_001921 [Exophiala dermatitidis]|nr:hypothetical protein HRR73_000855 [Exophiala dermatitidis]KAJ4583201.1 hypothetical protein HRR81_001936 [Exophiala dermatitidis]KAJ4587967.1 hypothetical protein HRR82_001756 [Exophiala dermatitidis]KAJ4659564.1 hypothetical protein HRR90_001921 [Exophiala dermatitidis]KAJ4681181.1 hypothetical protein HRR93_002476 [Exophiala dermatitidis]
MSPDCDCDDGKRCDAQAMAGAAPSLCTTLETRPQMPRNPFLPVGDLKPPELITLCNDLRADADDLSQDDPTKPAILLAKRLVDQLDTIYTARLHRPALRLQLRFAFVKLRDILLPAVTETFLNCDKVERLFAHALRRYMAYCSYLEDVYVHVCCSVLTALVSFKTRLSEAFSQHLSDRPGELFDAVAWFQADMVGKRLDDLYHIYMQNCEFSTKLDLFVKGAIGS